MCGIAGSIGLENTIDFEQLKLMTDSLSHRGPDDAGYYVNEAHSVGLGHRRLSIIDTSSDGKEPLYNEDKSIVLVFNGELYDYIRLRNELLQKGHTFSSKTDAEVLIHLYEEEGIDCLKRIQGMFAFALYDSRKNITYLVRDRFGIKPLYYTATSSSVLFGSEIRALFTLPSVRRTPNIASVLHYLSLNHVPAPQTGFEGIYKLLPSHYATVKGNKVELHRYYSLPNTIQSLSFTEAKEHVWSTFVSSVKTMCIADVPIGALLSGGIDSTAVVAALRESGQSLQTFSIAFPHTNKDETSKALLAAQYYDTKHTVIPISVDYTSTIDQLVTMYEEPYADSSAIAMTLLSHEVSKHVKVVLSGDGGDEIFAGYKRYLYWNYTHWALPNIYQKIEQNFHFTSSYLSSLPQHSSVDFSAVERHKFSSLESVLRFGIQTFLPDDLLKKVDIASMKYGLEVRVPFLHEPLVELALQLPSSYKIHYGTTKYILREILRNKIPEQLRIQKKQGFEIPLNQWCREDLFIPYLDRVRESQFVRSLLSEEYIHTLIQEHLSGKKNHGHRLWLLVILATWHTTYFSERA